MGNRHTIFKDRFAYSFVCMFLKTGVFFFYYIFIYCTLLPLPIMSVQWFCPYCNIIYDEKKKVCTQCHMMLYYNCISSHNQGLYSHYSRHVQTCSGCQSTHTSQHHHTSQNTHQHVLTIDESNIQKYTTYTVPLYSHTYIIQNAYVNFFLIIIYIYTRSSPISYMVST